MDSVFKELQRSNRQHFHYLWRKANKGGLDGLTEEEQRLAKVMLAHSDEYFNQFEFADTLADHQFNPESEVNPFLHVTLHAGVEKQIEDREPIEAFQFYNAMVRNKCNRHEAIHLLMTILVKFLFPVLKKKEEFDLDGYRKLLKTYKSRNPEKIIGLLEKELEKD
jgi:hypothetical protein